MELNKLTPEEESVIIDKGTEQAFTGKYENFFEDGTYICRQCGTPLYKSNDKFHSGCGWPSFDEEIAGAVLRRTDKDGRRTEIVCSACGGHLGHVFEGEGMTPKNSRHCVNSVSIDFVPKQSQTAVLGGGCFWCLEAAFKQLKGVIKVESGYSGGIGPDPDYKKVCSGNTGHAEVIKIEFDPDIISYELLLHIFFAAHDPTTLNRQGNDIGTQYRSIIFYNSPQQEQIALRVMQDIEDSKIYPNPPVTEIKPLQAFYKAEDYHQEYFLNNPYQPYCQAVISPKVAKLRNKFSKYLITDK